MSTSIPEDRLLSETSTDQGAGGSTESQQQPYAPDAARPVPPTLGTEVRGENEERQPLPVASSPR